MVYCQELFVLLLLHVSTETKKRMMMMMKIICFGEGENMIRRGSRQTAMVCMLKAEPIVTIKVNCDEFFMLLLLHVSTEPNDDDDDDCMCW